MKKKWFKKVFSMFGGAMVGIGSFGANLQTFVLGASEITKTEPAKLDAGKEYYIGTIDGFLHFRDLVNEGKVGGELKVNENGAVEDSRATITLTTNLDLTEGGEYTHGYCDRPIYKDGKVVGWYKAVEKDGGAVEWTVAKPDLTNAEEIDGQTDALEENKKYWIKGAEGYKKFLELKDESGNNCPKGIKVVLLGDVKNGAFVEPVKDKDHKLLSGWCEAEFDTDGVFQGWKKTGNGGGRYTPIGVFEVEIKEVEPVERVKLADSDGNPVTVKTFRAKFNGNEKEIKLTINIVKESGRAYAGVFGSVDEGGEICKLGIAKGSYISASGGEQSISTAGGIAGGVGSGATITGCYNTGEVSGSNAGGIAGGASGTITGCYNTGAVTASGAAGGIAGGASGATISGCYNTGAVSVSEGDYNYAGGIVGVNPEGTTIINGCTSSGAVTASSDKVSYAGGIAGYASCGTISGCYNTGAVTASGAAGGIAGGASGTITGCYNTGRVTASSDEVSYAGGIAGGVGSGATITGCYNTGAVKASSGDGGYAGGIAGFASGTITITGCYYLVGCAEKAVGKEGDTVEIKDVVALFAADLRAEGLVGKLNKATKEAVAAQKSEVLVETKKILELSAVPTTLDEAKQKLEEKLKTETSEELQNLLAKIKGLQALPADGKVFVYAFGRTPALWWEKVPNIELDLGHTRSSIGGEAGFYQNQSGVVTFKVAPNPGYKISEIVTSGSRIIRPGDVVKALPERVMVRFEKV